MNKEALNLADELLRDNTQLTVKSAYMIRSLVEKLDYLKDQISFYEIKNLDNGIIGKIGDSPIHDLVHRTTPQTKPLSDEEITVLWHKAMGLATSDENLKNNISHASLFARAIEERHGIK
jgi:hypothetical protein